MPARESRRERAERRVHLDFLPAALEIQQTPPSPIGRAILWGILATFVAAVAWAALARVDVVSTARGKVVPSGRVKIVQPAQMGVIRAIHVEEGEEVGAGDLLLELDPTTSGADETRLRAELDAARRDRARIETLLRVLARKGAAPPGAVRRVNGAAPARVDGLQARLLATQEAEYRTRLAAIDDEVRMRRAELAAVRATVTRLERTLPLVARRADALRRLSERKLAANADYLELEQARIEREHELEAQRSRREEVEAAIERARTHRVAVETEFRRARLEELSETERRIASLEQELVKAKRRNRLQTIVAPADGVVQQLAVHTPGGVVTPAQELMRVVPRDDRLEVEAWVANKDIGFVHEGQDAKVKLDAFPFTRYGTLPGRIADVSEDAVTDERTGLAFRARVALDRTTLDVDGRTVRVTPGMAVTAEVKTGTRRVLEFVLSPVLRGLSESARER